MNNNQCSDVLRKAGAVVFAVCCLAFSGCQATRQAQMELEQENAALERQIQENYAFMRHQQRRINNLEAQRGGGKEPPANNRDSSYHRDSFQPAPTASPRQARSASRSWLNPDTGMESEEPESQPAALDDFPSNQSPINQSPLDQIEVDPNGEPDISVPNSPMQTVPKNLFRNSDGSTTSVRPALPTQTLPVVNVSEIAEICGFENTYYFSTVFKNHIGVSPKNFNNSRLEATE